MTEPERGPALHPGTILGVALLSGAALVVQVALTRVFSITLWHHFASLVVGLALLGFGAAGAALVARGGALRPQDGPAEEVLARRARRAAIGIAAGFALSGPITVDALEIFEDPSVPAALLLLVLLSTIPFFGAGAVLATALAAFPRRAGAVYAADLCGAGAGSALAVLALGTIGAARAIFFAAAAAGLAACAFSLASGARSALKSALVTAVLGLCALGLREDDPWIRPAPTKEIQAIRGQIEHRDWSPIGRIDVSKELRTGPAMGGEFSAKSMVARRTRGVTQDGAAPTLLHSWGDGLASMPFLRHGTSSIAHHLRASRPEPSPGKTLVIGVGGGIDVLIALAFDASEIVGAEVNPAMLRLLTEVYRDFTGGLAGRPDVRLVEAEGRAFVRGSPDRFEVIQLSGVDTYTALAQGAYALAEAYLYTVEAVEDYLDHLEPGGFVSVSRWILDPPRETLRFAGVAAEALRRRGVSEPWRSLAVLRGNIWATTLVRNGPFPPEELEALRRFAAENDFRIAFDPGSPGDGPFDRMLRGSEAARADFVRGYEYAVGPVTDDRPFFFNHFRWRSLPSILRLESQALYTLPVPVAHGVLALAFVASTLLGAFGILRPLRAVPLAGDRATRRRALAYFAALGLAFLFVEIALLQQLTLFLGHPTYALSVVLAGLLVASGAGAAVSPRLPAGASRLLAAALAGTVLGAAALSRFVLPSLLGLPFAARVAAALLVIAPAGFFMGMPFPRGLERLRAAAPSLVPWAFSTNAFATVVAASLAVGLALEWGFTVLFVLAALLYLFAFATARFAPSSASPSPTPPTGGTRR